MKTVGRRKLDGTAWADQGALARTAAALRGPLLAPRGVFRFASFEEAETWMTEILLRTRARRNLPTSSGYAAP